MESNALSIEKKYMVYEHNTIRPCINRYACVFLAKSFFYCCGSMLLSQVTYHWFSYVQTDKHSMFTTQGWKDWWYLILKSILLVRVSSWTYMMFMFVMSPRKICAHSYCRLPILFRVYLSCLPISSYSLSTCTNSDKTTQMHFIDNIMK